MEQIWKILWFTPEQPCEVVVIMTAATTQYGVQALHYDTQSGIATAF